jgi:hypothetical protein
MFVPVHEEIHRKGVSAGTGAVREHVRDKDDNNNNSQTSRAVRAAFA